MKAFLVYETLKEFLEIILIHIGNYFDMKMSEILFLTDITFYKYLNY